MALHSTGMASETPVGCLAFETLIQPRAVSGGQSPDVAFREPADHRFTEPPPLVGQIGSATLAGTDSKVHRDSLVVDDLACRVFADLVMDLLSITEFDAVGQYGEGRKLGVISRFLRAGLFDRSQRLGGAARQRAGGGPS